MTRVLSRYAGFFQLGHDLPDGFVGVGHHVPEMPLGIVAVSFVGGGTEPLGIPIGGVRSRIEGAVGKNHRVIDEEGFLFVLVDKVADKVRADLRTIFAARVVLLLAVEFEQWVDETAIDGLAVFFGTAAAGMLPETGFLKTKVLRSVLFLAQLPLAGDRSCVTGCLELMSKGGLSTIQHAEFHVFPDVVLSGHDLGPRRCADRVGKAVGEGAKPSAANLSRLGDLQDSLPLEDRAS